MAELDDSTEESIERWSKAARYARGFADNGMGEALRVYYTRYFPTGVILYAVVFALVGILVSGDKPVEWLTVAQLGISVGGLLGVIAGLVYNTKRLKPRATDAPLRSCSARRLPHSKLFQPFATASSKRSPRGRSICPAEAIHLRTSEVRYHRLRLPTQILGGTARLLKFVTYDIVVFQTSEVRHYGRGRPHAGELPGLRV